MTAPGYPTYAGGGTPFTLTGNKNKDVQRYGTFLGGQQAARGRQAFQLDELLASIYGDPTSSARAFQSFFGDAAGAAAAPALRDFNKTINRVQANTASRFGGNASTEELRLARDTSDDFTRNLTEAIARTGPQAVAAGQDRDRFLLGARQLYGGEQLDLQQLLAAILGDQGKGINWGKILGTLGGGAAGFALGGPEGAAAGASVGQGAFG